MAAEVSPLDSQSSRESAAEHLDPEPALSAVSASEPSASTESPDSLHSIDPGFPASPPDLMSEPPRRVSPNDSVDFLLHPAELAKGRPLRESVDTARRFVADGLRRAERRGKHASFLSF